jgi:arylsulfatase A-like enzyme
MYRYLIITIFLGSMFLISGSMPADRTLRPNLIFLLTDDHRHDALGAMGNQQILTPNLDQLAAEGVLFHNAYVTTPICCISRASILSGQYARRHKINDFKTHFTPEAWEQCYPPLLKKAGYYTGFVGKYGVGAEKDFPKTDFDYWKGIPGQPYYEMKDEDGKDIHLTWLLGNQCLEFLENVPSGQPFCLSVSFKAPHVQDLDPRQFIFDPAYSDLYQSVNIPPVLNGSDDVYDRFPDFFRNHNEARIRWEKRFATPDQYQASVKGYYRLIYGVDVVVGKIRDHLEKLGLADNTILIFTGDNGFFLGEKGLAGKWYAYEESVRVPLIIYDPSLKQKRKGQVREQVALNIDIAPTLLDLANVPVPATMQGKSLVPVYRRSVKRGRKEFLFEHEFEHEGIPKSEGVISPKWKYFHYLPPAPDHEELYDLTTDPRELNNLATDQRYAARKSKMVTRMRKLIEKAR